MERITARPQPRLVRAILGAAAVSWCAHGALGGADDPVDLPETLLDVPSVTGLINDGDESVVDTIYVYLDGCPLLSITPPATGRGEPDVTMIERSGECVLTDASGLRAERLAAVGGGVQSGMHVMLKRDDPVEEGAEQGNALIVDVSNLYPAQTRPSGQNPRFWVPGVFGDPSGDLTLASGANDPGTLFGGAGSGGNPGGIGGGGGGGPGGPGTPTSGSVLFPGGGGTGGGGSGGGSGLDIPTAVPLPATLLLLLCALHVLRSYVRRR